MEPEDPDFLQAFRTSDYVVPQELRQLTREYTRTYVDLQQKCRRRTNDWKTCPDIFRNALLNRRENPHNAPKTIDSCALECLLNNLPTHAEYTAYVEKEGEENSEEDYDEEEEIKEPISWGFRVQSPSTQEFFQIHFNFNKEISRWQATLVTDDLIEHPIDLNIAKDLLSYYADRAEITLHSEITYGSESDNISSIRYSSVVPSSQKTIDQYHVMTLNPRKNDEPVTFYSS